MADVRIQTIYVVSSPSPPGQPYAAGQYIRVIGDGAAIRAELWTAQDGGTLIGTPSGGPAIGSSGYNLSPGQFYMRSGCNGTTYHYYSPKNQWPYATYNTVADHPSCAVTVCDLEITGVTTVNESTTGASDGQIWGSASTSNGGIKWSLTPGFAYADGQDLPITGLSTGNYTLYSVDQKGCRAQKNVFVGIDFSYGVRWRMEYDHVHPDGYVSRVDIEQRDYAGAIEETCGSDTPFLLEYAPDEETQLVPSFATIQLAVEQGEEGKFNDIRIGDDRQHIVKKYLDSGSGFVLEWVGYITPEFYEEPYIFEPYIISLKAIDGLGELKNIDFAMDSGEYYFGEMSTIKIISECLKKLPVQLPIRSCINIYEDGMNETSADDPLSQAIISSSNYRDFSCDETITSLIKPFTGAELFQSFGAWWIRTREQAVDSVLSYREFDIEGDYVSNDAINGRLTLGFPRDTSRMMWIEQTQLLRYSRPYGKFTITHNLGKDNNMIDSGGFEAIDIDPATNFFREWNLFPSQTLTISGIEFVDRNDSKGAFFFEWPSSTGTGQLQGGVNQGDNVLQSRDLPVNLTGNIFEQSGTKFKVKFDLYVVPKLAIRYARVGWRLRMINSITGDYWDWHPPGDDGVTPVRRSNRGAYDPSGGTYPASGGSGTAGAVVENDFWVASSDGTLPTGVDVSEGDYIIARTNSPGQTQANWDVENPVKGGLINDVYVDGFGVWNTYEYFGFRVPGNVDDTNYKFQFSFHFHDHKGRDFVDVGFGDDAYENLRNYDINRLRDANLRIRTGKRFLLNYDTDKPTIVYELQRNTDSESVPNIIRPVDYHLISNPFQWVKIGEYDTEQDVSLISKVLIDNFKMSVFPVVTEGSVTEVIEPPETATYSETVTTRNVSSLNEEVYNGDLPSIVAAEYIYNGWFKLSDGTATSRWHRSSVPDESIPLLEIYLSYLTAQGTQSKRLLSGSGISDVQVGYINSLVDRIDNRKYRFIRYTLDDKRGEYQFELEETLVGEDGESPPLVGEFSNEFSDDFNV